MTQGKIGSILRLVGPLVQVVSLIGVFLLPASVQQPGTRLAFVALFGLGFVLVVTGNVLAHVRRCPRVETPVDEPALFPRDRRHR